jgi:hypothetical protein
MKNELLQEIKENLSKNSMTIILIVAVILLIVLVIVSLLVPVKPDDPKIQITPVIETDSAQSTFPVYIASDNSGTKQFDSSTKLHKTSIQTNNPKIKEFILNLTSTTLEPTCDESSCLWTNADYTNSFANLITASIEKNSGTFSLYIGKDVKVNSSYNLNFNDKSIDSVNAGLKTLLSELFSKELTISEFKKEGNCFYGNTLFEDKIVSSGEYNNANIKICLDEQNTRNFPVEISIPVYDVILTDATKTDLFSKDDIKTKLARNAIKFSYQYDPEKIDSIQKKENKSTYWPSKVDDKYPQLITAPKSCKISDIIPVWNYLPSDISN